MKKLLKLLEPRKASYVEKTPEDVYRDVAEGTQFSPEDISKIGGVESQHGEFSKPIKGGSARGLFQFQPETAEHLVPGSSKSLEDMNTQAELMKEYLNKNKPSDIEDAYLQHNLGPTGARRFMNAEEKSPASDIVSHRVSRANPALYKNKTIEEAKAKIKEKLEKGEETADIRPLLKEILTGRR